MFPVSTTLKALISTLVERKESEEVPLNARRKADRKLLPSGSSRSAPTLESLNHDVFRLITLELHRQPRDLKSLASCSRRLRDLAVPVLFSRCRRPYQYFPSETIGPFVRHLTYTGGQDFASSYGYCRKLLECLPSLTSLTFENIYHLSWAAVRVCLSHPRITSVSFRNRVELSADPSLGHEGTGTSTTLSKFTYNIRVWRDMELTTPSLYGHCDLKTLVARESQCFAALVPLINLTLAELLLPMESAPILKMALLPWPKLRTLSINGTYWTSSEHAESLPVLLGSLPSLEQLSIRIGRTRPGARPRCLNRDPSESKPGTVLSGLRSLTVAYPDPEDDIFGIDTSHLHHLSICDWPRHYNSLVYLNRFTCPGGYPILSSTECLAILRRMELPELSSLELVYQAERAGTDDELLQYVAATYPNLAHLELHRYRADRIEEVDHAHIARLLTDARRLRTLRLNLDFHEDHGAYCGDYAVRKAWWDTFTGTLGWEIVDILHDACPLLDCVELLYHGHPTSTWVEFYSARCAQPRRRFVLQYDEDHSEPELMPHDWFNFRSRGPWTGDPEQDPPPAQASNNAPTSSEEEDESDAELW